MCGIVGYAGSRDSSSVLVDGLKKLEYRGYDSAGVAVFENGVIKVVKAKGRLVDLEEKMKEVGVPKGHCGIGHTRWATHGEPSDVNSHPHGSKTLSIVHNGIIENYLELKAKLTRKGYSFDSETDTEVVAKLLDYYYKGDPKAAVLKVIQAVKGSYALGMIFKDFPDVIYAVRKDSPLIVGLGEGENFIASDIPAVLKYTRSYYLIDENELVELTKDSVTVMNADLEPIEKEVYIADWDMEAAEKGGYPHFMLKEIHEQPEAFRKTVSPRVKNGLPELELDPLTPEFIKNISKIHIVACGTAMHAGLIGKELIEALGRIPTEVAIASEFRYCNPILSKNDLVVIVSQSGETADTLAALRLAKSQGVPTLALVNVVGSSIAREADCVLYTWAGPEIAVASTKAFTVQMALFYLIALQFALLRGQLSETEAAAYCEKLLAMPDKMQQVLDEKSDDCQYFASKFQNAENLFFIGRGLDYALSQEASLKLKEISYIHSEAYAAGELKHGTISLITEHVPVIALATQTRLYEKTRSNIKEVATRGAKVLLVAAEGLADEKGEAGYILTVPAVEDLFMPLLAILPLQLFAYYTSVLRGCDVDKPRNLAKSVTVE